MKLKIFTLAILLLLVPAVLYANEPLVPLIMLFLTPTTLGGAVYASLLGFVLILLIKCAVFIWKSDFKRIRVILFILIANIVSTLVGLIVAMMFTSSDMVFMGIVVLFLILLIPARRLKIFKPFTRQSTFFIAFYMTLITLITVVIFSFMVGYQASPHIYWPLKILLSIIAIAISLTISVLYEETVIARLYRSYAKQDKNFLVPVLWSNIVATAVIVLIGALMALPLRLRAPNFLIGFVLYGSMIFYGVKYQHRI
jgi:hypothetical protein